MSGHHVGDLASSFVEMAKAYEELPRVKAELQQAQTSVQASYDTIQRLELKLIDRSNKIDELHAKVREAEVARDDAELRFLEADDKLGRVAQAIAAAGEVVGVPSVIVKVEYAIAASEGETEHPLLPSDGQSTLPTPSSSETQQTANSISPEHGEGQSLPFSPESSPTDSVEVREQVDPIALAEQSATGELVTSLSATSSENASPQSTIEQSPVSAQGQSDPLPTAASPIAESTAQNTNASPSGDVNSPIASYENEPARWSQDWMPWAETMDRQHGQYNWPRRETPTQFSDASHHS